MGASLDAVHRPRIMVASLVVAREIQLIYKSSFRQTTEDDKPLASKMAIVFVVKQLFEVLNS